VIGDNAFNCKVLYISNFFTLSGTVFNFMG
jgi:hypothetical protein